MKSNSECELCSTHIRRTPPTSLGARQHPSQCAGAGTGRRQIDPIDFGRGALAVELLPDQDGGAPSDGNADRSSQTRCVAVVGPSWQAADRPGSDLRLGKLVPQQRNPLASNRVQASNPIAWRPAWRIVRRSTPPARSHRRMADPAACDPRRHRRNGSRGCEEKLNIAGLAWTQPHAASHRVGGVLLLNRRRCTIRIYTSAATARARSTAMS